MDMPTMIAKLRLCYHSNATSFVNVLNQLHIVSDEVAERRNKIHVMTVLEDIAPRLGKDVFSVYNSNRR